VFEPFRKIIADLLSNGIVDRRALPGETGADELALVPLPLQPRA